MNSIKQPKWKKVEYSRNSIIKAGKTVKHGDPSDSEFTYAIKVIDNWRAAHAFPLHVIYMHLRRMAKDYPRIIVAERLKRIDSILNKLKNEPTMSLWTMQDLGGCRFIVPKVSDVYKFANKYEQSRKRHIKKSFDDYITNPKPSGYRSLHVVYEYRSDKNPDYSRNMLIELQFRTNLQHLWATAVETMGLFTNEAIKSGQGPDDVKRFFALVSSLFAIREKQPTVPGTPEDIDELIHELESLNAKHNYLDLLSGINVANYVFDSDRIIKKRKKKDKDLYCILILDYNIRNLTIRLFNSSDIELANTIYNSIEATREKMKQDAVLIRVSSLNSIRKAYPNYFQDIGKFVKIVKEYL